MRTYSILLVALGIVIVDQVNATYVYDKPRECSCPPKIIRPKELPCVDLLLSINKREKSPSHSSSRPIVQYEPTILHGNEPPHKNNRKFHHDDDDGHHHCNCQSDDCLYDFCDDCKSYVRDKLIDLKKCVVCKICNKLQRKLESKCGAEVESCCQHRPPNCRCHLTSPTPLCSSQYEPCKPEKPCEGSTCDPVSLTLAYKLGCPSIPECKLQYGPILPTPIHVACVKENPCIPEERLYGIRKTVIELKPPRHCYPKCDDDRSCEEESCCEDDPPPRPPCYRDVGYTEVKPKFVQFCPRELHERCDDSPHDCPRPHSRY